MLFILIYLLSLSDRSQLEEDVLLWVNDNVTVDDQLQQTCLWIKLGWRLLLGKLHSVSVENG